MDEQAERSNYAAQRRELAVKIGLGRPRKAGRGARQSAARPKTAKRSRSPKTARRLTGANSRQLCLLRRQQRSRTAGQHLPPVVAA